MNLKKQTTTALILLLIALAVQGNAQATDSFQALLPQEQINQMPTTSTSAPPSTDQPVISNTVPPLGGNETTLTPATPQTSSSSTATVPQPGTPTENPAGAIDPNNPAPQAAIPSEPKLIEPTDAPPELTHPDWMDDPRVDILINEIKYCKDKQDCDDFAQQLHILLNNLNVNSTQVGIYPGLPKPPSDGGLAPLVLTNLNPIPKGHVVVSTTTVINGKTYMCMYEPQDGELYGCTEVPSGELSEKERNEYLKKLAEVWMEENHPDRTYTIFSTNELHNIDPTDGTPPIHDPETPLNNTNDPYTQNISNVRYCLWLIQQDGSSKWVCEDK